MKTEENGRGETLLRRTVTAAFLFFVLVFRLMVIVDIQRNISDHIVF